MAILDQIMQMKSQGIPEQDIISQLQEQGINPKAINDAINQSKVKEAVYGESNSIDKAETLPENSLNQENSNLPPQEIYSSSTAPYYPPQQTQQPFNQEQYPSNYSNYAPQEGYEENYNEGISTDVAIEVSEQIFEEKSKKIFEQLRDMKEFFTLTSSKLIRFEERLKKVESVIDNLQIKILEKIGSYGQGVESIKKEMSMMQNSFSKMIPNIVPESKKVIKKSSPKKTTKRKITKK